MTVIATSSSTAYDLLLKKDRHQRAGCQHYWVIDPDVPAITAWTLRNGAHLEVTSVTRDEPLIATEPSAITLIPSALVDR